MQRLRSAIRRLFGKAKGRRKSQRSARSLSELRAAAEADGGRLAFYAAKNVDRPRFIYRRLARELDAATDGTARSAAIAAFRDEAETRGGRGEGLKLRWSLPAFVIARLGPDERAKLDPWIKALRGKRARLRDTFPDCADEFGVDGDFLETVLDVAARPAITRTTRIFTLGSCFARNIAVYLSASGYQAEAFMQTEDLNSPFSNARMLSIAAAPRPEREAFVDRWLATLYPDDRAEERAARAGDALDRLARLAAGVSTAEVLIVTIGGALDFFLPGGGGEVAPKFLLLADTEGADKRAGLAQRLKANGATFRLGTFAECRDGIARFHAAVRALNPTALCVFTLSPVPMDSALGLQKATPGGAVEIDCVSKSTLRAALHDAMTEWNEADPLAIYFPSYEIVRWVAPNMPGRVFGAEDASARHVSEEVLNGVYGYFLSRFGDRSPAAHEEPTDGRRVPLPAPHA